MTSNCPRCGEAMSSTMVRSMFWRGDTPAIVEDIPAFVCSSCTEQFYDKDVSEALRRLVEEGFPADAAKGEVQVAVFSLKDRIRRRAPLPDDAYVD